MRNFNVTIENEYGKSVLDINKEISFYERIYKISEQNSKDIILNTACDGFREDDIYAEYGVSDYMLNIYLLCTLGIKLNFTTSIKSKNIYKLDGYISPKFEYLDIIYTLECMLNTKFTFNRQIRLNINYYNREESCILQKININEFNYLSEKDITFIFDNKVNIVKCNGDLITNAYEIHGETHNAPTGWLLGINSVLTNNILNDIAKIILNKECKISLT